MKWVPVEEELPTPTWHPDGGPLPVRVLVYSSHIDDHAIAEYAPYLKPAGRQFVDRWVESGAHRVNSPDVIAARSFRDGELITHWAPLTRPGPRKGESS